MGLTSRCAFTLLLTTGCSSSLPVAPTGPHRVDIAKAVVVGYPAPPAQVECVPKQPRADCVWLDGIWRWGGRRWQWIPGSWVVPPQGCYYAPAYSSWVGGETEDPGARDQLFFFEARWYPTNENGACPAPEVCSSAEFALEC